MLFYLFRNEGSIIGSCIKSIRKFARPLRKTQAGGSLAGAVYLLNHNAGVLRGAQWEQKSHVDQKGKSLLDFDFQYEYKLRNNGLSIL